jgi:hypothetical protein
VVDEFNLICNAATNAWEDCQGFDALARKWQNFPGLILEVFSELVGVSGSSRDPSHNEVSPPYPGRIRTPQRVADATDGVKIKPRPYTGRGLRRLGNGLPRHRLSSDSCSHLARDSGAYKGKAPSHRLNLLHLDRIPSHYIKLFNG